MFGATIAVDSDGDGFVTNRSANSAGAFARTRTGLSVPAYNILETLKRKTKVKNYKPAQVSEGVKTMPGFGDGS